MRTQRVDRATPAMRRNTQVFRPSTYIYSNFIEDILNQVPDGASTENPTVIYLPKIIRGQGRIIDSANNPQIGSTVVNIARHNIVIKPAYGKTEWRGRLSMTGGKGTSINVIGQESNQVKIQGTGSKGYFLLTYDESSNGIPRESAEATSTPFQRIYGELIHVIDIDGDLLILDANTSRDYDLVSNYLKLYPVDQSIRTNLTIEGVHFVGFRQTVFDLSENRSLNLWLPNGLFLAHCDNLTVRNLTVERFNAQGIYLLGCRDITLDNIRLTNLYQSPDVSGSGYAIQPNYVTSSGLAGRSPSTISNIEVSYVRYGVSVTRGTANLTVGPLTARVALPTGAAVDIHGGDCLNLTFTNILGANGIVPGNSTWRRGANYVDVLDSTVFSIFPYTAIRNLTVSNCYAQNCQITSVPGDNGNGGVGAGYMNSTGANLGYLPSAQFEDCTFAWYESNLFAGKRNIRANPLVIGNGGSTPQKVGELTFVNCIFDRQSDEAGTVILVTLSNDKTTDSRIISFESCQIIQRNPTNTWALQVNSNVLENPWKMAFSFAATDFVKANSAFNSTVLYDLGPSLDALENTAELSGGCRFRDTSGTTNIEITALNVDTYFDPNTAVVT